MRPSILIYASAQLVTFLAMPSFGGAAPRSTVVFQQPNWTGIANADGSQNVLVPPAKHIPPSMDRFAIVSWEPNPKRNDRSMIPTNWDAGVKTGLEVPQPYSKYQTGFDDSNHAVSTVQVYGTSVGVYMNSADLKGYRPDNGTVDPTFIITPGIAYSAKASANPSGQPPMFADSSSYLALSMDLQIPTAVDEAAASGCSTYAFMDIAFKQKGSKNLLTYDVGLFFHGQDWSKTHSDESSFFDARSNHYVLQAPLVPSSPYVTYERGSMVEQGEPWKGFRPVSYELTYQNFQAVLAKLAQTYPKQSFSTNPSDYTLDGFHLNAEMQYLKCRNPNQPVEMGWSMRNQKLVWGHS